MYFLIFCALAYVSRSHFETIRTSSLLCFNHGRHGMTEKDRGKKRKNQQIRTVVAAGTWIVLLCISDSGSPFILCVKTKTIIQQTNILPEFIQRIRIFGLFVCFFLLESKSKEKKPTESNLEAQPNENVPVWIFQGLEFEH